MNRHHKVALNHLCRLGSEPMNPQFSYDESEISLIMNDTWKNDVVWCADGYYTLATEDTGNVPVRLFLTAALLEEAEAGIYQQIVNATQFPGVKMVIITPDVHIGYGVPIGCVLVTDGTLCLGPVGFDIGCGILSAKSDVPWDMATPEKRMAFNAAAIERIEMGVGGQSTRLAHLSDGEFDRFIHEGADYYCSAYGTRVDRSHAERNRLPVDDSWQPRYGGKGRPERGKSQIGSLGSGNHFCELQRCLETDTLFLQAHTGSRGFGHGLATNYFALAKEERPEIKDIDMGYFTPDSAYYQEYLNAVNAGGNFAIVNRLVIFEQLAEAFEEVFGGQLELIYEISHNLVQYEWLGSEIGHGWVHRKGATRAFPAGHPALAGTLWEETGHPILIPGSNRDYSFILRPALGAYKSAYSVNHGAGRRLSRNAARKQFSQQTINDEYREAGILVNTDGNVPIDEAGQCYKSSKEVVEAVVSAGLATIEYTLWPLSSLKGLH